MQNNVFKRAKRVVCAVSRALWCWWRCMVATAGTLACPKSCSGCCISAMKPVEHCLCLQCCIQLQSPLLALLHPCCYIPCPLPPCPHTITAASCYCCTPLSALPTQPVAALRLKPAPAPTPLLQPLWGQGLQGGGSQVYL